MAADQMVLDVVVNVTWIEDDITYPDLNEVFLHQAGKARSVIEYYDGLYRISSGHLQTFYHLSTTEEWEEWMAAIDTYNTLVAS